MAAEMARHPAGPGLLFTAVAMQGLSLASMVSFSVSYNPPSGHSQVATQVQPANYLKRGSCSIMPLQCPEQVHYPRNLCMKLTKIQAHVSETVGTAGDSVVQGMRKLVDKTAVVAEAVGEEISQQMQVASQQILQQTEVSQQSLQVNLTVHYVCWAALHCVL